MFNAVNALAAEISRLEAECSALRKDAERYRWLRQYMAYQVICDFPPDRNGKVPILPSGRENYAAGMDSAIDARMEAKSGWVCRACGTDRTKAHCPRGHGAAVTGQCPMVGTAA